MQLIVLCVKDKFENSYKDIEDEKFLFKRLRGNQVGQTPVIRPKGRWHDGNKKKKKDWIEIRRGVLITRLGFYRCTVLQCATCYT